MSGQGKNIINRDLFHWSLPGVCGALRVMDAQLRLPREDWGAGYISKIFTTWLNRVRITCMFSRYGVASFVHMLFNVHTKVIFSKNEPEWQNGGMKNSCLHSPSSWVVSAVQEV